MASISVPRLVVLAAIATTASGFLAPIHVNSLMRSAHRSLPLAPNRCGHGRAAPMSMNTITDLTDEIHVLRNELVRKDAIIEGLLATLAKTAITTKLKPTLSSTPLTDLCQLTKEACDAVSPMLQAFYAKITDERHGGASKLKSDATYFTIADGIVQHMFIEHLFAGGKFAQIVGEEDESKINIMSKPYTVDDLVVPEEFNVVIEATLTKIKQLSSRIDPEAYKAITVFVDPIDGTREFATGQGEYVTILIGYNDAIGHPVAGIMYRPVAPGPATWAAGAKSENCVMGNLDMANPPHPTGMLITDAKVSPFISDLIDELGYERVRSVASGNRAMMLLEGKGAAYIRDTGGFAKWDTSGPQAVLEAYGGVMSKLPGFLKDQSLESYTHLKTQTNLDFVPGMVSLTISNARNKKSVVKGQDIVINDVNVVREYSCLQGLVALDKACLGDLPAIHAAMLRVKERHPPTFT